MLRARHNHRERLMPGHTRRRPGSFRGVVDRRDHWYRLDAARAASFSFTSSAHFLRSNAHVRRSSCPSLECPSATASWAPIPRSGAIARAARSFADRAASTIPSTGAVPGGEHRGGRLVVHVAGDVTKPGVVGLPGGSRVIDAVEAAGGGLPDADLDRLNLAAKVVDGQRILVQKIGEPHAPA